MLVLMNLEAAGSIHEVADGFDGGHEVQGVVVEHILEVTIVTVEIILEDSVFEVAIIEVAIIIEVVVVVAFTFSPLFRNR